MLLEQTGIIEHIIRLKADKQLSYKPIYSLGVVKLKIFKIYIKTNLGNGFICLLKPFIITFILFVYKFEGSLRLYIHYKDLNNLISKNQYPLPLIGESINWLDWVKCISQLNFTSIYHWMRIKECNK